MKPTARLIGIWALACLLAAGCRGPGHVEFTQGQCVINGRTATLAEVEERQARISERILARQPLFVLVTILIVGLAGFSHLEKLLLLFSTRHSQAHGLAERLRLALERYRAHPVRYFSIVVGTLSLLGIAAGFYVYLDADKRASERALGLLQFCHLALRDTESQGILAEQRRNLQEIQSTAGNIRALVDNLPPAEQRKAKEIVSKINLALQEQGKLVGDYAAQTESATRAVRDQTENLQKGLSSLGMQVLGLKSLPAGLHDLTDQVRGLDDRLKASDGKLADADTKLTAIKAQLDAMETRLDRKCPAEPVAVATPPEKDNPAPAKPAGQPPAKAAAPPPPKPAAPSVEAPKTTK